MLLPVLLVQRLFFTLVRAKVISVVVLGTLLAHGAHPENLCSHQTAPPAVFDGEQHVLAQMRNIESSVTMMVFANNKHKWPTELVLPGLWQWHQKIITVRRSIAEQWSQKLLDLPSVPRLRSPEDFALNVQRETWPLHVGVDTRIHLSGINRIIDGGRQHLPSAQRIKISLLPSQERLRLLLCFALGQFNPVTIRVSQTEYKK